MHCHSDTTIGKDRDIAVMSVCTTESLVGCAGEITLFVFSSSCKHFNIDPTPDGQFAIGTLVFPAIADIVHHYQNNSLFIHEGQHVTLSSPARRRTRGADIRPHS